MFKVCSFINKFGGWDKIVQFVVNYVVEEGMIIVEVIDYIECDFNDNLMEY